MSTIPFIVPNLDNTEIYQRGEERLPIESCDASAKSGSDGEPTNLSTSSDNTCDSHDLGPILPPPPGFPVIPPGRLLHFCSASHVDWIKLGPGDQDKEEGLQQREEQQSKQKTEASAFGIDIDSWRKKVAWKRSESKRQSRTWLKRANEFTGADEDPHVSLPTSGPSTFYFIRTHEILRRSIRRISQS